MDNIMSDLSTPGWIAAIEANLYSFFSLLGRWAGATVHDEPELLSTSCDIPFPVFNSILRARLTETTVDAAIEAAISRAQARNAPLLWWTDPSSTPTDLGAALVRHGFTPLNPASGMAVDLQSLRAPRPLAANVTMEQVTDVTTLSHWCDVLCASFELPEIAGLGMLGFSSAVGFDEQAPYQNYIAWLDGEPVATSSLFLGGGAAGIYNVGVVASARRQGIGAAITHIALLEARARGCRVAILHASEMGLGAYSQLGFREYCKIGQYVWTGGQSS